MNEKILNIYRSILSYGGMFVREDGTIYLQLSPAAKIQEVSVAGEPLVFPIRKQLDDPDQNKTYFHPFAENFLRGESEVIQTLREMVSIRLNYVTAKVGQNLLAILGSPAIHKSLNEEQASLLMAVSEADGKSAANWGEVMVRIIKADPSSGFVKLYLKRAGTWKSESYSRLGVITFPFYHDLTTTNKYEGLRVKDKAAFKKTLEYMFPNLQKVEAYNYGTRTQVAPFLDALMMSSVNVASRLNDIVDTFKEHIDDSESLYFDLDWLNHFQDLDALRSDIRGMPELRGNAGVSTVQERNHPAHEVVPTPPPAPTPVAAAVPTTSVAPLPVQYQQPVAPTVPAQPQAPVIRQNEQGAISFTDVVRASPTMAYIPNPLGMPQQMVQYPGQAMPMNRPPSHYRPAAWERSSQPMMGYAPNPVMVNNGYNPTPGPVMYGPQPVQMIPPGYPPPHPGYQYVVDQQGQYLQVPIQPTQVPVNYNQAPQPGMNPPGPGWHYR